MKLPNFLEVEGVDEANKVDLKLYTFVRYSEKRDKYIFKRREK